MSLTDLVHRNCCQFIIGGVEISNPSSRRAMTLTDRAKSYKAI